MLDFSLVFFNSVFFILVRFSIEFYIQRLECSRLFVRSLVARHLIRRWSTGNIKFSLMQKDIYFHQSVGEKLIA